MKTTNKTLIAALAGIALTVFVSPAQAQYKPTGDDGITASPRLRQIINERNGVPATQPAPSDYKPMSCAKCQDISVAQRNPTAKGAQVLMSHGNPTVTVAKHLCDGCGVEWSTVRIGGAKPQSVATHKCTSCGAESFACCSIKKSGETATKGMEKKFEIAPLK